MNTPGKTPGGRFKGIPYFNGGLFANPARIELSLEEITLLKDAAKFDWSKVRPEIFGAIFEHSMDFDERRAYGAHYTSPVDIMKVVGPTIVEPWQNHIDNAKTLTELEQLLMRIENFRVLDPACGSGNFLYVAYRELKRLEARIYERMSEWRSIDASQRPMGFVSTRNFFGLDINPFAVELAKVTMMLAHKLAIDELHVQEQALPLDNLDANFGIGDALICEDGSRTPWPEADVIIGNPPFLGAKLLKPQHGVKYVKRLRSAYPEVPGMADFCVYWFRRAEAHLPECTATDWFAGRAGLVGTQNIRNNDSRIGGLDFICDSGTIIEAVESQPWSGEANVHVSIANWVKTQENILLPKSRRLWFKIEQATKARKIRGSGHASKDYELDIRQVPHINASLSDKADVGSAVVLPCNTKPQITFQGITPGHAAFVLSAERIQSFPTKEQCLISPYLVGDEVLSAASGRRFLLNFGQRSVLEAQVFPQAFAHVQQHVLPARQKAAEKGKDESGKMRSHHRSFLERWWQLSWGRLDMLGEISKVSRYLACSRVTKRPIFTFVDSAIRPGDALQVFVLADDYSFGILQASAHYEWFHAKCSNMKSDPRYTSESVFDTFPWPQDVASTQVDAVAKAGRQLRRIRDQALQHMEGGLRALYRTLDLPGKNPLRDAHLALDAAVLKAYGFTAKENLLKELLKLNHYVAARISAGNNVNGPGVPAGYPVPEALLTDDAFGKGI
jgi:SAM-dependent methyltransferase